MSIKIRKGKPIEVDPQIDRWRKKYKQQGVLKDAPKEKNPLKDVVKKKGIVNIFE